MNKTEQDRRKRVKDADQKKTDSEEDARSRRPKNNTFGPPLTEIGFSILARRLLKRASFTSIEDLQTRVLDFIHYFNHVLGKPFRWTYTGRPLQARPADRHFRRGHLGMNEEEVRDCMGETRALAESLQQPAAMAVALSGVGALHAARGDLNGALEIAAEALGMCRDDLALSEIVAIEITAYRQLAGGRLALARAGRERVLRLCSGDPQVGRELVGFSPLIWAEHLTGVIRAHEGRFEACWPQADRATRRARENQSNAPENLGWALGTLSLSAYLAGGMSRVPVPDLRRACVAGVEIAEGAIGNAYS